jgi:hypothetical protein
VPFGIIYSFQFHRYQVSKIRIKADSSVDVILMLWQMIKGMAIGAVQTGRAVWSIVGENIFSSSAQVISCLL